MRLLKLYAPALIALLWVIVAACVALSAALLLLLVASTLGAVFVHVREQVHHYRDQHPGGTRARPPA